MLAIAFLHWWYGPGWRDAGTRILERVRHIYLDFSVPILLRTLFAPWRRIVTAGEGSLSQHARAMLDNIVSRFVGLAVRLIALLAALVLMGLSFVMGGLIFILWPLIPPLGIILVAAGFFV